MAACNPQKKKKSKDKEQCIPPEPAFSKKQTINEATICSVCTKRYVSPKLLPCFHTVCLACLKRRSRGKMHGDFIKCPLCHCKFIVPGKGVEDFQSDFLVEYLLQVEEIPAKEKHYTCESCPAESDGFPVDVPTATSYCTDCFMKLCEYCTKSHERMRGKNHRILTLGKQPKPPHSCSSDSSHQENVQKKLCFDCQANICDICQTCKFDKAQEMCKQISDSVTAFMQQLEDDIETITAAISSSQVEVKRLHREKNSFMEETEKTEAAIVSKGEEVKKLVDMQVESVLEDLLSIKSRALEKLAWSIQAPTACIFSMRAFQSFAQLVKTEGTPYIISRVADELNMHSRATFLLKWQQETKSGNYHTPKVVFNGVDVESYLFPNGDKGSLIGKLSMLDYMPGWCAFITSESADCGTVFLKIWILAICVTVSFCQQHYTGTKIIALR